ncbi:hypothetical protein [Ekhidna sp.]|uniref:hypothetical protein n=1 Tax=Ekhidna sp. TaxID=2608089 RepID=UPI0032EB1553
MKRLFTIILLSPILIHAQTNSPLILNRTNEVMIKLQDGGGDYTGFWTMNDGIGNMAIKLGNDGTGKHIVSNDGAAELLFGAHGQNGYISLNAAKKGTAGDDVTYSIALVVDSEEDAIKVAVPNNSLGGTNGVKIADGSGALFADALSFRTNEGLDIDLGSAGGDIFLYDGNGTKYILGDQDNGNSDGIVLRTTTNPANGQALFSVESSGNSERLRVEHSGALSTTNYLQVRNTGQSYVQGKLAVSGTTVPAGYQFSVDGKAIMEEVKVELSGTWPDYVFEPTYNLRTLEETEEYIKTNKHLPEIPSAKEMEANGVELGEMNMLLLKKIEELTLHLIDVNKENTSLRQQLKANSQSQNEREAKQGELEKRIEELTLHTIEQQKMLEKQGAMIEAQGDIIKNLEVEYRKLKPNDSE